MPKVKNQRYRFLSIDEANMLITCLSNRKFFSSMLWRDFTVLSMNTGIRPNKLFNLRRCHIYLKNKNDVETRKKVRDILNELKNKYSNVIEEVYNNE